MTEEKNFTKKKNCRLDFSKETLEWVRKFMIFN